MLRVNIQRILFILTVPSISAFRNGRRLFQWSDNSNGIHVTSMCVFIVLSRDTREYQTKTKKKNKKQIDDDDKKSSFVPQFRFPHFIIT